MSYSRTRVSIAAQRFAFCLLIFSLYLLTACQSQSTPLANLTENDILFLSWDDNDIIQLFAVTPDQDPIQLTSVTDSIQTYAISPNKEVAFATEDKLYMLSPTQEAIIIFDCTETVCDGFFWESNGLLGFRYANNLWWIDPASSETRLIFEGDQIDGKNGRLSPDENWLSYITSPFDTLTLVNRITSEIFILNGGTNTNASWHPDGIQLVTSELISFQDSLAPHILHLNTITQNSIDLSTSPQFQFVSDNWPNYSPDGTIIAFIRQIPQTNSGGQLWLMDNDGNNQRALTNDPIYTYGPPHWSQDQTQLLAQQASVIEPTQRPSIILLAIDTKSITKIVEAGFMPKWVP